VKKKYVLIGFVLTAVISACGLAASNKVEDQYNSIADWAHGHSTYVPKNRVELNNYEKAQKLYDDPSTIIWCTVFPSNNSLNAITIPIAGKLTSSTTSWFPPDREDSDSNGKILKPNRSVDGLYHPNPPKYRYGFTPGGQYVDIFNAETVCTTVPYKFKRQQILVNVNPTLNDADNRATKALKSGNPKEAQRILQEAGQ
jgi:hypothetical protein